MIEASRFIEDLDKVKYAVICRADYWLVDLFESFSENGFSRKQKYDE